ncbi:hypothetical protein [Raoultella terrigena]|uniref:hypothetical protein n=1 Tax=Raoultella terrigena TaxID=577 RepID=UPI001F3FEB38|nr:hypothetical protein [Raoultella terrigena]
MMKIKMCKVLPVILATMLLGGCNDDSKADGLTYKAGGGVFYLSQSCVQDAVLRDVTPPNVFLKITKSETCSEALNKLISDNINNDLVVSFKGKKFLNARIGSSMKTENGFNLSAPDRKTAQDIYSFYRK